MDRVKLIISRSFLFLMTTVFLFLVGCQDDNNIVNSTTDPTTDQAALEKIALEDSSTQSFEVNFEEETAIEIENGAFSTSMCPIKIGKRFTSISRTFNSQIVGDTAYATLTTTYEGQLIIEGDLNCLGWPVSSDTTITKSFTAQIQRNFIYVKVGNNPNRPLLNWKLIAVSLAEGEAPAIGSDNISIQKITVYLANGDTISTTDPLTYYLFKNPGNRRILPVFGRNKPVTIEVSLYSAYSEDDFVVLNHGRMINRMHGVKTRFELVSSEPSGNGYLKLYRQTFTTNQYPGFFFAIVEAMPAQVFFETDTSVEASWWGVPYLVF